MRQPKNASELRKTYGRTMLSMGVLQRVLDANQLEKLNKQYEGVLQTQGGGVRTPTAIEEKWFREHVDYPGSLTRYAREIAKQDPTSFRAKMYRVAYHELVVKKLREAV